jgi:hypothetical protein
VLCEDLSVSGVLAGRTPLALSSWAGRTGLSELPPLTRPGDWLRWAGSVRLNLSALHSYARAVYAATDRYLAMLPAGTLDPARDEGPARLLSALLLTLSTRRGEIRCLLAFDGEAIAGETQR